MSLPASERGEVPATLRSYLRSWARLTVAIAAGAERALDPVPVGEGRRQNGEGIGQRATPRGSNPPGRRLDRAGRLLAHELRQLDPVVGGDHLRRLLADHDRGRVGIPAHDVRHHAGIRYPE